MREFIFFFCVMLLFLIIFGRIFQDGWREYKNGGTLFTVDTVRAFLFLILLLIVLLYFAINFREFL